MFEVPIVSGRTENQLIKLIKWQRWVDPWFCCRFQNEAAEMEMRRENVRIEDFKRSARILGKELIAYSLEILGEVSALNNPRHKKFRGCEFCKRTFRIKELQSNYWNWHISLNISTITMVYGEIPREQIQERLEEEKYKYYTTCRSCAMKIKNIRRKADRVRENFYLISTLTREIANARKSKQQNQNNRSVA